MYNVVLNVGSHGATDVADVKTAEWLEACSEQIAIGLPSAKAPSDRRSLASGAQELLGRADCQPRQHLKAAE